MTNTPPIDHPAPSDFNAEGTHGGIRWSWSPVGDWAQMPDGSSKLALEHEIEVVCDDGSRNTTTTVRWPQFQLENIDEGIGASARVRVLGSPNWSTWKSAKAKDRYTTDWHCQIGKHDSPVRIDIPSSDLGGPKSEFRVPEELRNAAKKHGIRITARRTRWSGSSGAGQPIVVNVTGAQGGAVVDGSSEGEKVVAINRGWWSPKPRFKFETPYGASTLEVEGGAARMAITALAESPFTAIVLGAVAFVIPSCINALDTKVGREIWWPVRVRILQPLWDLIFG